MDNIALLKKAREGDKRSKAQLIEVNIGLVWCVVNRFLNRGYEKEDLFQIGCIGMIKAIDQFDFKYEVAFSTYAVPMIMGEIKRFLRDDGIIKISRKIKENQIKIEKYRQNLIAKTGREPTIEEISKECYLKKEDIIYAMEASGCVISVDSEKHGDVFGVEQICAESTFEQNIVNRMSVISEIERLEDLEKRLIILRYFENMTQKQTGIVLGISQVKVSRLEKNIIGKLKLSLEA